MHRQLGDSEEIRLTMECVKKNNKLWSIINGKNFSSINSNMQTFSLAVSMDKQQQPLVLYSQYTLIVDKQNVTGCEYVHDEWPLVWRPDHALSLQKISI